MSQYVPYSKLINGLRRAALSVLTLAVSPLVASAQPASPLQFIRLHRLDNVVVPFVHPATDGARPIAGVVQASDGQFYGTTICGGGTFDCSGPGAGTVFRLDAVASVIDGSAFMALHAFTGGADGGSPYAPLIQAANGLLYGTTICGGGSTNCFDADPARFGHGTIFSIDPATGTLTTLHVFQGTDGTSPYGALVQGRDGNLYGTTFCGGSAGSDCLGELDYGGGTIFRFNPTTGTLTTLRALSSTDLSGCSSISSLIEDKATTGLFYGTMGSCGANGGGTVFKIDASKPPSTNLTVLHPFTGGTDGASPAAPLLIALDGSLYGTAEYGGYADGHGVGTVFKLNTNGTGFTTLHTFNGGLDGGNPYAGVIQAHDGTLYGTSFYLSNQAGQTGTIFRLDPGTTQFETLYTFSGGFDGQNPSGALAQINESLAPGFTGSLVGTTLLGPTVYALDGSVADYGSGVIFRYVPPPLLLCPASVVTNATSLAGASVTLSTTLIDPANTATTITWSIDGVFVRSDLVPAAASAATSTRTTKSLTATYLAGKAGTPGSVHAVSIQSVDALGLTSSCAVTVEVDKLDQAITFVSVPVQTYKNPNGTVTLSATSSSGLPVTFAVVSGPGSLSANTLTITGAGAIVIQASQAGNGLYNPAPDVPQTITVNKAVQTITFPVVAAQTFGNPPVTLAGTTSSGLAVIYTVTGPATISGSTLTITGAGSVTVTASQPGDSNYSPAASVARTFTVAKGSQTITFPPIAPQTVGNPPVTLAATATSGLPVTYTVSGPATISGNLLTVTGAGTVTVTAVQAGNANINAATSVSQSVVVKANQTITFTAVAPQTFGGPPITLAATASSGLAVSFSVVSGPATLSGNVLTVTGAGTVVVAATQNGNATYNAASVQQSITVGRGNQTIAFPSVPTQFVGFPPVTLGATASSGLPVSYTVSGPGTLSGNVLTITGAGTIVVTASQPGNGNYNPAVPVQQNISVLDASQSPLNRFVAFSSDSTWLSTGTVVATGDVGANERHVRGNGDDDDDHDRDGDHDGNDDGQGHWHSDDGGVSPIEVRLDNGVVMQQASSRVVGDTVLLGPGAKIYNLVDNQVINVGGTILGARVDTMPVPYLTMPAFPAISVGTGAITAKKNTTTTLAAGSYGRVSVESGATLKLSGGLYQFVSLDVDHDATVLFQAAVQLRIQTSLDADSAAKLILDPAVAGLRASQVVIYVKGTNDGCSNDRNDSTDKDFGGSAVVNIGERAIVQANIYAPNGSIWLKSRSQGTGAFIGRHVVVGSFSRLTLDSSFF